VGVLEIISWCTRDILSICWRKYIEAWRYLISVMEILIGVLKIFLIAVLEIFDSYPVDTSLVSWRYLFGLLEIFFRCHGDFERCSGDI